MVSTISGPIPTDLCYDRTDDKTVVKVPAARVRPEAADIARQGRGTLCLALEIEGHSMPSAYRRTSMS